MSVKLITSFGFAVLRLSTPLVFAALSAAICEKAGLFNMAAESMMLWGALIGVMLYRGHGSRSPDRHADLGRDS